MKKLGPIIGIVVIGIIGLLIAQIVLNNPTDQKNQPASNNNQNNNQIQENLPIDPNLPDEPVKTNNPNPLCDWVDKSDIIIKVNIAEGVEKDTSYEAGFYYSNNYFNARVAREACEYRTGFMFSELKDKGVVQIGVSGYTDSRRRKLKDEPINVTFNSEGKPSVGNLIQVTVLD